MYYRVPRTHGNPISRGTDRGNVDACEVVGEDFARIASLNVRLFKAPEGLAIESPVGVAQRFERLHRVMIHAR